MIYETELPTSYVKLQLHRKSFHWMSR